MTPLSRCATILAAASLALLVPTKVQAFQIADQERSETDERSKGQELFEQYEAAPESETGSEAGWRAFMRWSNAGAADLADAAMTELSNDSELWSYVMHYVHNAYQKSAEHTESDYFELLIDLESRLTHPASQTAVLFELAQYHLNQGRSPKARELYQQVVNLDAREFFVDQALGALYEMESLAVGDTAPIFQAESLSGENIFLEGFTGEYVLLEFWATWCAPCYPKIPHLKELWATYGGDGLQIVGISLDGEDRLPELATFLEREDISWPQIVEGARMEGVITSMYNVVGIPNSYLIGPNGSIVAKNLRVEQLAQEVKSRLGSPE